MALELERCDSMDMSGLVQFIGLKGLFYLTGLFVCGRNWGFQMEYSSY